MKKLIRKCTKSTFLEKPLIRMATDKDDNCFFFCENFTEAFSIYR